MIIVAGANSDRYEATVLMSRNAKLCLFLATKSTYLLSAALSLDLYISKVLKLNYIHTTLYLLNKQLNNNTSVKPGC